MTDDLVAFMRRMLDADAEAARAAGGRDQQVWEADLSGKDPLGQPSWPVVVRYTTDGRLRGAVAHLPVMDERSEDRMMHIARWDPARVLADVDAKRRIVDAYAQVAENDIDDPYEYGCGWANGLGEAVRLLAAAYRDQPGYRPEWAPNA